MLGALSCVLAVAACGDDDGEAARADGGMRAQGVEWQCACEVVVPNFVGDVRRDIVRTAECGAADESPKAGDDACTCEPTTLPCLD